MKKIILLTVVIAIISCNEQQMQQEQKCYNPYKDSIIHRIVSTSKEVDISLACNDLVCQKAFDCDSFRLLVEWRIPVKFTSDGGMKYNIITLSGDIVIIGNDMQSCKHRASHEADSVLMDFIDRHNPELQNLGK